MGYTVLTLFLLLCTVALYFWFFRANDADYEEQKHIILDDDKTKESGEGNHESRR
ncbi:MAG: cbb3-type cytochrome c oxidase subunit 3 [Mariprofundaceae bacterium]